MADKCTQAGAGPEIAGGAAPADREPTPRDFETALAELEALVAQMENGTLSLDQSLVSYEKGVELARICQQRLDAAEQQVRVLQGNLLKPLSDSPGEQEG